jgi:hypothetical protein
MVTLAGMCCLTAAAVSGITVISRAVPLYLNIHTKIYGASNIFVLLSTEMILKFETSLIRIRNYSYGSRPFHQQVKKSDEPKFLQFCYFLSLKTDVKVLTISNKQNNVANISFGILKANEQKSRIRIQWYGSEDPGYQNVRIRNTAVK